MKKNLINTIAALIILSLCGAAWAENSLSISVSCAVPVLPGLNAPLLEEKTVKTDTLAQEKMEIQQEAKKEKPAMVQEETVAENTVQTLYVR